jgi:hypothetical protein
MGAGPGRPHLWDQRTKRQKRDDGEQEPGVNEGEERRDIAGGRALPWLTAGARNKERHDCGDCDAEEG